MKKFRFVCILILLLSLCGCGINKEISETRFVLDTVATLTADCGEGTLSGAFSLCENYEKQLSRTIEESEVYRLNNSDGFIEVSQSTTEIINRSIYYSDISDGRFDITIYPVSSLWDFKNQIMPEKSEIAEALKNVDYKSIEINGNKVNLNGKKIDLGGIAKGYIADKTAEYLKENGAKNGIVNLGGNVVVFGKEYNVGINRPFGNDSVAVIRLKNKAVVTSGIYQRYIEQNGKIYHHIIDKTTGYGVENELASVTVIGDSSFDCDALSTVLLLLGHQKAAELVETLPDTEAVFIDRNENITYTSGIYSKNSMLYLK